ncbi:RNA polymerase sigma factor [Limibacter armeniacum]|uniref:RNA polymerase sigma factor n=1 Tax=Limibacter armeniacum TaxID=466084 RepID=UPI002FE50778
MTEKELVEGCVEGNRKAQKRLFELYAPNMLAVAARYSKSIAEAEDILQDAFIKIFDKISTFKGDATIGAWIKRIVINTALNSQRRKLYDQPMEEVDDRNYHDMQNIVLSDYSFNELLGMIQSLPSGCQIIFNLYAIEGYSHKEIADQLDISEGTSKSQYSRAKQLLQQKIKLEDRKAYEKAV